MPYTDDISKITNYTPYIETTPIKTLEMAGMQRQQQYNQGLELIAQQNQQVTDLESHLPDPQHKEYLKTKLSKIQNQLSGAISGDLSNTALVHSIGGAIKSVANDKVIKQGLLDAAAIKSSRDILDKDLSEGKSSPSNEYDFNKSIQEYYNTPLLDTEGRVKSFNGKYKPFFDIWKFAKDTFDAVKPSGITWDDVYQTDKNGKPLMINGSPQFSPIMQRHKREGRDISVVTNTLNQIFSDPRVEQQLQIDGKYNYRQYDTKLTLANGEKPFKDLLLRDISNRKNNELVVINNQLLEANIKNSLDKNNQTYTDKLLEAKNKIEESYNKLSSYLDSDPDYVKGVLYKDDVKNRYTKMFFTETKEDLALSNPGANYALDVQKEKNKQANDYRDYLQRERHFEANKALELLKLEREKTKNLPENTLKPILLPQDSNISLISTAQEQIDEAAKNYTQASDAFIFATALNTPKNMEFIAKQKSLGKTEEEAMNALIISSAKANGESPESFRDRWRNKAMVAFNSTKVVDYKLKNIKENLDNATRQWNSTEPIRQTLEPLSLNIDFKDIKDYTSPSSGKTFSVTKGDMIRLAQVIKGESSTALPASDEDIAAAKAARKYLQQQGKESLIKDALDSDLHIDMANNLGNELYATTASVTEYLSNTIVNPKKGLLAPLFPSYNEQIENNKKYVQKNLSKISEIGKILENQKISNIADKLKAQNLNIRPNVDVNLFTKDSKKNEEVLNELARMASIFEGENNPQNSSKDFNNFKENLKEKDYIPHATVTPEGRVIVNLNDSKNEYVGSMELTGDMAKSLGINIETLFLSKEATNIKNYINSNQGKSYKGFNSPTDPLIYQSGNAFLESNFFPGIQNTGYDAKANIVEQGGIYYPYLYIADGVRKPKVLSIPPKATLEESLQNLKQTTTPQLIEVLLSK